jgi:hypothetical protein
MPDDSGVTVVTNSCAFYFAREAAGASSARHSLHPLISKRCDFSGKTRAERRRERGGMFSQIIDRGVATPVLIEACCGIPSLGR